MRALYNEWERCPAQWLENLIAANLITPGTVDQRSIADLRGADLAGYDRAHFFAGIAGWELALELAGWPRDLPVWTGSCPCQPFSTAGKRGGADDERHLWPAFHRLIAECRPPVVFGEQVASADGRAWLSAVRADLEALGYAIGAADLCAAGAGAPHIRQRLWWVAHSTRSGSQARSSDGVGNDHGPRRDAGLAASQGCDGDGLGDPEGQRLDGEQDSAGEGWRGGAENSSRLGHPTSLGPRGRPPDGSRLAAEVPGAGCEVDPWRNPEWLPCSDGKARPTQPGLFPLAHGVPGRVGKLRAAGNAIVPQVAAHFVRSFMDAANVR